MKALSMLLALIISVVTSFVAAFITASWSDVEIRIPSKLVGVGAGVLAFAVVLVVMVLLASVVLDLVFYTRCRSTFRDLVVEGCRDRRILLAALIAFATAWAVLGSWVGFCECWSRGR